MVGRPYQWAGCGLQTLLKGRNGREALPESRKGSGIVRNPFHWNGSGREALPKVPEWSGGPPVGSGVIGNGREALPYCQD